MAVEMSKVTGYGQINNKEKFGTPVKEKEADKSVFNHKNPHKGVQKVEHKEAEKVFHNREAEKNVAQTKIEKSVFEKGLPVIDKGLPNSSIFDDSI